MKQLYYTSCEAGKSLGGSSGFQVRAASSGLSPDRIRAALRYVGYSLPPTMEPTESTAVTAPVRLALLDTPDVGRLLCQSRYVGKDPTTGRYGNFFTHLLFDVPDELDGGRAIRCWGSSFWRHSDGDIKTELSEMIDLPLADEMNDTVLAKFLAMDRDHQEMYRFVLAAFLSSRADQHIYLAAPARDVAICVYGLARVLPPGVLKGLSFSTYESDPLGCFARLVGTCWPDAVGMDLPTSCYSGSGLAFNSYSNRRTRLLVASPYAEFAADAAIRGDWDAIDNFCQTSPGLDVTEGHLLDLVFRLKLGRGEVTKDDLGLGIGEPKLAPWIASRPGVAARILGFACEDPAFCKTALPRALNALVARDPATRSEYVRSAVECGSAVIRGSDVARARNLFESVLNAFEPREVASIQKDLFESIDNPTLIDFEIYKYIVYNFITFKKNLSIFDTEERRRWLSPLPDQIERLLSLDLSQEDKVLACCESLRRDGQPSAQLVRALSDQPALALGVLERMATNPMGGMAVVISLFEALLEGTKRDDLAAEMVREALRFPAGILDACLERALDHGRLDVAGLIKEHGKSLVRLLERGRILGMIVDCCLDGAGKGEALRPKAVEFLQAAAMATCLDEMQRAWIRSRVSLESFLKRPNLEERSLASIVDAIAHRPQESRPVLMSQVLHLVGIELLRTSRRADPRVALENTVCIFGRIGPDGPSSAYCGLLRGLGVNRKTWKRPSLLHALFAVALGDFCTRALADQLRNCDPEIRNALDVEARTLIRQVAERGGPKVLAAIDALTRGWNRESKLRWNKIMQQLPPSTSQGFLPVVLPYLIGMLIGVILCMLFVLGAQSHGPRKGAAPEPAIRNGGDTDSTIGEPARKTPSSRAGGRGWIANYI